MIKFSCESDKLLFLSDCGIIDYDVKPDELDSSIIEGFLQQRAGLVKNLKRVKRLKDPSVWEYNRWSIITGIRRWIKTIDGKRLHRPLARYLTSVLLEEPNKRINEFEILKAVSSLKTHLYIAGEYYRPLDEDVDYYVFVEYAIPLLSELEYSIFSEGPSVDQPKEVIELLLRIIDKNDLALCISENLSIEKSVVFDKLKMPETSDGSYNYEGSEAYIEFTRETILMLRGVGNEPNENG